MSEKELTSVSRIRNIYLTLVRHQLESVGLSDTEEADRRFGGMLRRVRAEAWDEGYEAGSDDGYAWQDVTEGYVDFDEYEDTHNPYREDT